jgi:recombinase
MPTNEPLRSFASMPPDAPSEVSIEYDCRGRRQARTFDDAYEARQFYARMFKSGKRPRVVVGPRPRGRRRGPPPFGGLPGEAEVVERIRRLRAEGLSLSKIAATLNSEKTPTRTGAPWSKMTVRSVLKRE